jgi:hypothetical protein
MHHLWTRQSTPGTLGQLLQRNAASVVCILACGGVSER